MIPFSAHLTFMTCTFFSFFARKKNWLAIPVKKSITSNIVMTLAPMNKPIAPPTSPAKKLEKKHLGLFEKKIH